MADDFYDRRLVFDALRAVPTIPGATAAELSEAIVIDRPPSRFNMPRAYVLRMLARLRADEQALKTGMRTWTWTWGGRPALLDGFLYGFRRRPNGSVFSVVETSTWSSRGVRLCFPVLPDGFISYPVPLLGVTCRSVGFRILAEARERGLRADSPPPHFWREAEIAAPLASLNDLLAFVRWREEHY